MASSGVKRLAELEKTFAESKSRHLLGTARVRISQLEFQDPIRPLDQKIVTELLRDFKAEGCLQHEHDCSVPAIIDENGFFHILRHLEVDADHFKTTSTSQSAHFKLPDDVQLQCLHGLHRIYAASKYLPIMESWWLVDLYSDSECRLS